MRCQPPARPGRPGQVGRLVYKGVHAPLVLMAGQMPISQHTLRWMVVRRFAVLAGVGLAYDLLYHHHRIDELSYLSLLSLSVAVVEGAAFHVEKSISLICSLMGIDYGTRIFGIPLAPVVGLYVLQARHWAEYCDPQNVLLSLLVTWAWLQISCTSVSWCYISATAQIDFRWRPAGCSNLKTCFCHRCSQGSCRALWPVETTRTAPHASHPTQRFSLWPM